MLFEMIVGDTSIACAISRGALQDLSERRSFKTEDLHKTFLKSLSRIEQMAQKKLQARSDSISGTLHIWADDLDDVPPSGTPAAGHACVDASGLHAA